MRWLLKNPVKGTLIPSLLLSALLTVAMWYGVSREALLAPWLLCWLVAINVTAFTVYGADKSLAKRTYHLFRVPEATLLTLAFLGGTIGAYIGMRLFRHKTLKGSFRTAFWILVAVQVVLIGVLVRYVVF